MICFRNDADIQNSYGLLRKRLIPPARDYSAILKSKTRLVAWIVSNNVTQSRRNDYVSELQKYIQVDIYGQGQQFGECPREHDDECMKNISANYKFYLGFENSFCDGYISEKFYKYFNLDLIVVARGVDEYANLVPPEVFINTWDYDSPKQLADKLLYLDSHDADYLAMLKGKDEYFTIYEDYMLQTKFLETRYEAVAMCQVCQRLWNLPKYSKTIPDINVWYNRTKIYPPSDVSKT